MPVFPQPLGSGDLPQLYRLPGLKFQALCRDLLDAEPEVQQCTEFGVNGEAQFGIDLLSYLDPAGVDVAQCKAEEEFTPAKIRSASEEFLDNRAYWNSRHVRRFLVLVGSEVKHVKRIQEIEQQRARFRDLGLVYDLWDLARIVNKLRPHRGVVTQHLTPEWADTVCGRAESALSLALARDEALIQRLAAVATEASGEHLAQMKGAWLSGQRGQARDLLTKEKGDRAVWLALSASAKAALIRFEASMCLDSQTGMDTVPTLLEEASRLAPDPADDRLRAVLLFHQGQADEALTLLSGLCNERAVTLRASLLLSSRRPEEAWSTIGSFAGRISDAETLRIQALCHFALGRTGQASLAIKEAEERQPGSFLIRLTSAAIEYYSSLVPFRRPAYIPAWPEPVPWQFVLRSDEAIARLRSAALKFAGALTSADLAPDERQAIEAWHVGCLGNLPDEEEAAGREILRLLGARPVNHRLVVWATIRFPHLDVEASAQSLREASINGEASPEQITALAHHFLYSGKAKKAWDLLSGARHVFSRAGAEPVWGIWAVRTNIALGDLKTAKALLSSLPFEPEEARRLGAGIRRAELSAEGLLEYLDCEFADTGDPQTLLELVERRASARDWVGVANRVGELAAAIPSAEVVTLCTIGAFNARRAQLCLEVMETYSGVFPGSRLPAELRRIRVQCRYALGSAPDAIGEAVALAAENPSVENLLDLSQLYFSVGDRRRHAATAERLIAVEGLGTGILLRLSWQLQTEDRALAARFWRQAVGGSLPDHQVVHAVSLGYSLGLDDEIGPLLARMAQLGAAGQGGIQLASFDDVKQAMLTFQENSQRLIGVYDRGEAPIHLIAPLLNLTLAELYHSIPESASDSPFAWTAPCVWTRNGRLSLPAVSVGQSRWRLTADTTALLMAEHFGYLALVEDVFRPIRISRHLIPSFAIMQDSLSTVQPQRVEARRAVTTAVETGGISVADPASGVDSDWGQGLAPEWRALAEEAVREEGLIIDFIPVRDMGGSPVPLDVLPAGISARLIGQKAVLSALLEHGPLTGVQFDELMRRAGSLALEPVGLIPEPGSKLFFAGTAIETLAGLGVLPEVNRKFRVFVARTEFDRLKSEGRTTERRGQLASWIGTLVRRISTGIMAGDYEVLPEPTVQLGGELASDREGPDATALKDVMQAPGAEGDFLWADDRWLNGHTRVGALQVTDSVAVLSALVDRNRLGRPQYFEILGRMRAEGMHFTPLSTDEISSGLRSARVTAGRVVEAGALSHLRRGIAAELLKAEVLQKTVAPGPAGPISELAVLVEHHRACIDALKTLWMDGSRSRGEREALADWILTAIYADPHALRRFTGIPANEAEDRHSLALTLASAVVRGLTSFDLRNDESPGREFVTWIFGRLIERRARFDPRLLDSAADYLKALLVEMAPAGVNSPEERAALLLIQTFILALPQALGNRLARDPAFVSRVRFRASEVSRIGPFRFAKTEYLRALSIAVDGRIAHARELGSRSDAEFRPEGPPSGGILIAVGQSIIRLADSTLDLLSASFERRAAIVPELVFIFDLPASDGRDVAAELASIDGLEARMRKAELLRVKSATAFYADLQNKLETSESVGEANLAFENPESMLQYLRLTPNATGESLLSLLIKELVDSGSLIEASRTLDKLLRLPIPVPDAVINVLRPLSGSDRDVLARALLRLARTPLFELQLSNILVRAFADDARYLRLVALRLRRAVADYLLFNPYLKFLRWSLNIVTGSSVSCDWSVPVQLAVAWVHGDRIFGLLRDAGYEPAEVAEHLNLTSARLQTTFEVRDRMVSDVANPHNLEPGVLLLAGLAQIGDRVSRDFPLRQCVASQLLADVDGAPWPVSGLLCGTSSAENAAGSIFLFDRIGSLENWVPNNVFAAVAERFGALADQEVVSAVRTGDCDRWPALLIFLGSFPPRAELRPGIIGAVLASDFTAKARTNSASACTSLHIATWLSRFIDSEIAFDRLTDQLLSVARVICESGADANSRTCAPMLLECALNLSSRKARAGERVALFAELATRLSLEWPVLGMESQPLIQHLCEVLRMEHTTELWRLNCRLRTQR